MADVQPLRALHYDLARVGGLQPVAAPPYDVIDAAQRAELVARSPYNVVEIDLPQNGSGVGGDPYDHASDVLRSWTADGIVVRDATPALWALAQDYTGPDGRPRTRHGVFARVRVEDYGAGRIRPHERTHPGPKEDRLKLTRATRANLSPIFSLFPDASGAARATIATRSCCSWRSTTRASSSSRPTACSRTSRTARSRRRSATWCCATSRSSGSSRPTTSSRRRATGRSRSATWTPTSSSP